MSDESYRKEFLTVKQFADLLGVHIHTVYSWIDKGKLPHIQIKPNTKYLIHFSAIHKIMKKYRD